MPRRPAKEDRSHLLGLGLDNRDGHMRLTRGENFTVVSGSEETHERMTELCIKVNERLDRQGRPLGSVTPEEIRDIASDLT